MIMWTFNTRTGELSHYQLHVEWGYSGQSPHRGNPDAESIHGRGPIPRGSWTISLPHDSKTTGPITLNLSPRPDTQTFGRSGFAIHGDSGVHPGQASTGCIVLSRPARLAIAYSGDTDLEIIST
jgi:hypothetical protein